MPLEFNGDALCLSGTTGSKLKTEIVSRYYELWLDITTGGKRRNYGRPVSIVDMNAGTGELSIQDANEIILGSAGHVLDLRYGISPRKYENLSIILLETHKGCRERLSNVISRRWPQVELESSGEGRFESSDGMTVLFTSQNDVLNYIEEGNLNKFALFYFDPLRSTEWSIIDRIAEERIEKPFQHRTEFLVFFFTSDWVRGRTDFAPLPRSKNQDKWSEEEKESAAAATEAFGGKEWMGVVTSEASEEQMMKNFVYLYRRRLRKWFRFVQPLPFIPKKGERYDLFSCSNFHLGARLVSKFYQSKTGGFDVQASADEVYHKFIRLQPKLRRDRRGTTRPVAWKVLWQVIKYHPTGVCDKYCSGIQEHTNNRSEEAQSILEGLEAAGYLYEIKPEEWPWEEEKFPIYSVNWDVVEERLEINRPCEPDPLKPGEEIGRNHRQDDEVKERWVQDTLV
ncbi:MAG: three-Cys-motif partner protein TcmP [Promethearchaeati archaeon]